jgi:hypothetical protein
LSYITFFPAVVLRFSCLFHSVCFHFSFTHPSTTYLPTYLSIYISLCTSIYLICVLSLSVPTHPRTYLPTCLPTLLAHDSCCVVYST